MASKMTLQLSFMTDLNKKIRISIPNPKQPLDNALVDSVMDLLVTKQAFVFPQGNLVKKVDAQQVQTDTSSVG
jgi:hypothetical protein